jgi:hypothetical protein
MKSLKILVAFAVSVTLPLAMFTGSALRIKALPQAIITESGSNSVIIAETGNILDGLPVRVKLVRYRFATNKGVGVFDGRPATRFCTRASFPSHQTTCRYSTMPFDPNAVGRQQAVNFETWVAVTS